MNEQNPPLENWNDVRAAYHVARLGTLSAAAAYLGVHHATVIRQIDALETRLGCKLFQRHPRGYTPTEAGQELLETAAATEVRMAELAGRLRGRGAEVSGELIITMLSTFSPVLMPHLAEFQRDHPDLRLTVILDERLLRLEYAEAHLAIRVGTQPQEPDNVVQMLGRFPVTLFAHRDYVAQYGPLLSLEQLDGHRFVAGLKTIGPSPLERWIAQNVPEQAVVFRASEPRSQNDAVRAGIGIGFMTDQGSARDPDLVPMCEPLPQWHTPTWLVTHRDLHRTAKVQAITRFLLDRAERL